MTRFERKSAKLPEVGAAILSSGLLGKDGIEFYNNAITTQSISTPLDPNNEKNASLLSKAKQMDKSNQVYGHVMNSFI